MCISQPARKEEIAESLQHALGNDTLFVVYNSKCILHVAAIRLTDADFRAQSTIHKSLLCALQLYCKVLRSLRRCGT